jgi:hypothetical protein
VPPTRLLTQSLSDVVPLPLYAQGISISIISLAKTSAKCRRVAAQNSRLLMAVRVLIALSLM